MKNLNLKCLFVHDNKFKQFCSDVYTDGNITDDVFRRYVESSGTICVISRMQFVESHINLSKITLPNIEFKPLRGLSFSRVFTLHIFYNFKLAIYEISNSDFIVVRLPSFTGIFILTLNLFFRKKYFVELVGDARDALLTFKEKPNLPFKMFVDIFSKVTKYFVKNAHGVIYVTKNDLQRKYPNKNFKSYASNVEVYVKNKVISVNKYRKKDVFKVGCIGSFNNHYKGIIEAIKATRILKDKNIAIELHILGSGTLKKYYESKAKDIQVHELIFFDGIREAGDEVINWLEGLDLYIQPSYTEGLPRALIEAMSVGLPAVATDVGGISELLTQDNLVLAYDSKALADRMEVLLTSKQLRFETGKENYHKAKEYDKDILERRRSKFWQIAREIVVNT